MSLWICVLLWITISLVAVNSQDPDGPLTAMPSPIACGEITEITMCLAVNWTYASFPNLRGHMTQDEANIEINTFLPLVNTQCSNVLVDFLCSVYAPFCSYISEETFITLKPCREVCTHVRSTCEPFLLNNGWQWPEHLECDNFPSNATYINSGNIDDLCLNIAILEPSTPSSSTVITTTNSMTSDITSSSSSLATTSETPQPPVTEPSDSSCVEITDISMCLGVNWNNASFPNVRGHMTQDEANIEINTFLLLVRTQCSNVLVDFLCSVYAPFCSYFSNETIITLKPCREVCTHVRSGCEPFLLNNGWQWPQHLECDNFPSNATYINSGNIDDLCLNIAILEPSTAATSTVVTTTDSMTTDITSSSFSLATTSIIQATTSEVSSVASSHSSATSDETVTSTQTNMSSVSASSAISVSTSLFTSATTSETPQPPVTEPLVSSCVEITDISLCLGVSWNNASFPNLRGHMTQDEANTEISNFLLLVNTQCSNVLVDFLCSVYAPFCSYISEETFITLKPCREVCTHVRSTCEPFLLNNGFEWPEHLECDNFPSNATYINSGKIDDLCLNIAILEPSTAATSTVVTTTNSMTTDITSSSSSLATTSETPQPPVTEPSDSSCVEITDISMCLGVNWNNTFFPNVRGHMTQDEANIEINTFLPLVNTQCSNVLVDFLCSVYAPFCSYISEETFITLKPCREVCTHVRSTCEPFLLNNGFEWPEHLECDNFPSNATYINSGKIDDLCLNIAILEPSTAATSTLVTTTNSMTTDITSSSSSLATTSETPPPVTEPSDSSCVEITDISMCLGVNWNNTFFPNVRGHMTQDEANIEINTFLPLVNTQCSNVLVDFLCSVYAPFCSYISEETFITLKPCREVCTHVRSRCEPFLLNNGWQWPQHLECDNFPSNATYINSGNIDDLCLNIAILEPSTATTSDITSSIIKSTISEASIAQSSITSSGATSSTQTSSSVPSSTTSTQTTVLSVPSTTTSTLTTSSVPSTTTSTQTTVSSVFFITSTILSPTDKLPTTSSEATSSSSSMHLVRSLSSTLSSSVPVRSTTSKGKYK